MGRDVDRVDAPHEPSWQISIEMEFGQSCEYLSSKFRLSPAMWNKATGHCTRRGATIKVP